MDEIPRLGAIAEDPVGVLAGMAPAARVEHDGPSRALHARGDDPRCEDPGSLPWGSGAVLLLKLEDAGRRVVAVKERLVGGYLLEEAKARLHRLAQRRTSRT